MTAPTAGHCLNCGTALGNARFCPQCGQRATTRRITWRDTLSDIYRQLLEGDNPWPRTLKQMTLNPGRVAREYVEGKRTEYVHPLRYAFYLVLVATVLTSTQGLGPVADPLLPPWRMVLVENIPLFILLISPIAALTLRVIFWNTFNAAEIWTFVLFLFGQLSVLFVVVDFVWPLTFLIANEWLRSAVSITLILLPFVTYYGWAVRQFFGGRLDYAVTGALASLVATMWIGGQTYIWLGGL